MNSQNRDCSCAEDRAAIEARFQRAKQALLDAQVQHCAAAHELLLARAQVQQLLELVFPEQESSATSALWEKV